jgi:hypothetical protein
VVLVVVGCCCCWLLFLSLSFRPRPNRVAVGTQHDPHRTKYRTNDFPAGRSRVGPTTGCGRMVIRPNGKRVGCVGLQYPSIRVDVRPRIAVVAIIVRESVAARVKKTSVSTQWRTSQEGDDVCDAPFSLWQWRQSPRRPSWRRSPIPTPPTVVVSSVRRTWRIRRCD